MWRAELHTSPRLSCHYVRQARKGASMHIQLCIDRASSKALRNTTKRIREKNGVIERIQVHTLLGY